MTMPYLSGPRLDVPDDDIIGYTWSIFPDTTEVVLTISYGDDDAEGT